MPLRLIVVHNHFRPGGVRRVIELATPHLLRVLRPEVREVVLASGERFEEAWLQRFRKLLAPATVASAVEPALGYLAEQHQPAAVLRRRLAGFIEKMLGDAQGQSCLVWAHNQSLGRNLLLTEALARACAPRHVPLVLHHHDWWFDNRWARWPEMRRAGFRTLAQVADTVFASAPNIRHAAINQADAAILQRHFPQQAGWLPNLAEPEPPPPDARVQRARRWLAKQLGQDAPVWLLPCRLLRRKNIAEALLLTRWLRPEAWLVTTGGVSSAEERDYARRLADAARRHGWRLRLSLLDGDQFAKPSVPDLLAASEVVLLSSLLEGFGLPYLETASAGRPLIARALPNIAPDLAQFGFRFPHLYDEVLVEPRLFDWAAEQQRQRRVYRAWRQTIPCPCRRLVGRPRLLALKDSAQAAPFSRLTLTAQLDVLAQPVEHSWALCAPLNPELASWRESAAKVSLRITSWPGAAARWLNGRAYARRFLELVDQDAHSLPPRGAAMAVQEEFIRAKLASENLYPLLWNRQT
jgi:glycosyltransferase involved in cell wall biosynthesis